MSKKGFVSTFIIFILLISLFSCSIKKGDNNTSYSSSSASLRYSFSLLPASSSAYSSEIPTTKSAVSTKTNSITNTQGTNVKTIADSGTSSVPSASASKKASSKAPSGKASSNTNSSSSFPIDHTYDNYTPYVETHSNDVWNNSTRFSDNGAEDIIYYSSMCWDLDGNWVSKTRTSDYSTAPRLVGWAFTFTIVDYAEGRISFEYAKNKYKNKYFYDGDNKSTKYVLVDMIENHVNYIRDCDENGKLKSNVTPDSIMNQIINNGLYAKKYDGLVVDLAEGTYSTNNPKVGTAYRLSFIIKRVA